MLREPIKGSGEGVPDVSRSQGLERLQVNVLDVLQNCDEDGSFTFPPCNWQATSGVQVECGKRPGALALGSRGGSPTSRGEIRTIDVVESTP